MRKIKAYLRKWLHWALLPLAINHWYTDANMAYAGWVDLPLFGTIAFITRELDLVFEW